MKVLNQKPPNWDFLLSFFPITDARFTPLFPWGDIIYNPTGVEIPEDILFHEEIHAEQQKAFANPELWWTKYCYD